MVTYQVADCAAPRRSGIGPLSNNTVDPTGNKMSQICIRYTGIMMSPGHCKCGQGSAYKTMSIEGRIEF